MFTGSGVAIVTPFKADGSVNYDVYEKLINDQIENGTDAIITCGTTGEASTLSDDEQIETIRAAVAFAKKRVPVIAGTGSNVTEHGVFLCKSAEKVGADGCLVVTPYYNKCTQNGLVKHFTEMAKAVSIPLILYNVPGRTNLNITPKTVYELSKVENITAIKEASGNIVQIMEIVELCGDRMVIYAGNDDYIVPVLSVGGKGVISVIANIAPRQTHDLCMKFFAGDVAGSMQMQVQMQALVRALFCEVNPIPVKAAMNLLGENVGALRMPLTEMEPDNLETLKKEMIRYGLKVAQ